MSGGLSFERERDAILGGMTFKPRGAFLAGGAITSTFTRKPIADYDLYFKTKADFVRAVEEAYEDGLWCVSSSGRAITFASGSDVFQLMHFAFFSSAEEIFESFDFTCCMAAIDLDTKEFRFHPNFLADTSKRELVFNHRTAYPIASAVRVLKYQDRGYTIRKAEALKIATACSFKQANEWAELAEQVGGRYGRAAEMDTSKPFDLDNAMAALDKVADALPVEAPGTAEEALRAIFPDA